MLKKILLFLTLLAVPTTVIAQQIPQIEITARGSGYYRVFVDALQVSQHTTEREAIERWTNILLANPSADAYYDHDYWVSGRVTGIDVPTPPVDPEPPVDPNPGGVAFSSSWNTARGNTKNAINDGGNWPVQICNDASWAQLFNVVDGATIGWTATPNALQITNRGSAICGLMGFEDKIPQVDEYFVRIYINALNLSSGGLTFHSVKQAWGGGGNPVGATYWAIADVSPPMYRPRIGGQHVGLNGPYQGPQLNQNTWYRFEYRVEFFDPTDPLKLRIWPYIYDMAGNLVADADDYMDGRFTPRSLAQDYAAGGYRTTETRARGYHFFLGYEGTAGNERVGDRWAYAGVEIRTDRFPGSIGGN